MAFYLSVMTSFNNIYLLLCFLMWIPFCRSLEGQHVCKIFKEATDAKNRKVDIIEFFCCAGYKAANNKCVECSDCTHIDCPPGFCGEGCLKQCECTINAHCHPEQCCVCNKGFYGQSCDKPCVGGTHGEGCMHTCLCSKHSTCDRFTGKCICFDGWTGDTCTEEGYSNVTCSQNCNCRDTRCSNNSSDCECHLDNLTTAEPGTVSACEDGYDGQGCSNKCMCQREQQCDQVTGNCSTSVNKPGNQLQKTEVFKLIVIAVIIVAVVIIIPACISLVITFSRNRKEKYRTTEPMGHYGEIHSNDEIILEEFETQQEPLCSTPTYANGVMHPLQPIERNSTIETTNIYDASTSFHPDRGCKIHKYMSLPILSSKRKSLEQDNKLKRLNTRSCNQLPRQTLYI
ncbi:multiple epidermal growth factor-like domains protein 10 isoform X1 [Mytilus californianus]|uniref:multiple epidermal growth factor-like domains protein 10 isoform X1 n=1 Tax=Mytilus californianus TaxID=6549 RepID=UPI002247FEF9|nr:multiple epidermal growth factor-like domains protein 10 isoform X1 [Mytilus californianus]